MSIKIKSAQTDSKQLSDQMPRTQHKRLFATAAHDLRQPLQTLNLIQGILESRIKDEKTLKVVTRLGETLDTMNCMLDALLDPEKTSVQAIHQERVAHLENQSFAKETFKSSSAETRKSPASVVYIVDDDHSVREDLSSLLTIHNHYVEAFESCEQFLLTYQPGTKGCLLIDAMLPDMSGLDLIKLLRSRGDQLPSIMITGNGDISLAVQSMKAGASDFVEKPIGHKDLLASVTHALQLTEGSAQSLANKEAAVKTLTYLSIRERQIMERVLAGDPSKNIAADLGISQRTVETHRANIMRKTGSKSLPALLKLALTAA